MPKKANNEVPQRSCLGCREIRSKDLLIRYVLSPGGEVVPDFDAKLPGRGAYTCICGSCLAAACSRRQFSRAFKRDAATPPAEDFVAQVAGLLLERILGSLGLANRAGKIVSGGSLVCDAIRSPNKPSLVLVATDVSSAIGERIESLAAINGIQVEQIMTKDDFGRILGKAQRSAVAVRSGGFAVQLPRLIKRYRNFLGEVQNL